MPSAVARLAVLRLEFGKPPLQGLEVGGLG